MDNTEAERNLKFAIRTRKNSLFYFSSHGALIGSILMSVIATCLAAGVNAIEYLTLIQKNKSDVFKNPEKWFSWDYELNDTS